MCMTHGHGLRWGNDGGGAGYRVEGNKGEKKRGNCNSIINKIYFLSGAEIFGGCTVVRHLESQLAKVHLNASQSASP